MLITYCRWLHKARECKQIMYTILSTNIEEVKHRAGKWQSSHPAATLRHSIANWHFMVICTNNAELIKQIASLKWSPKCVCVHYKHASTTDDFTMENVCYVGVEYRTTGRMWEPLIYGHVVLMLNNNKATTHVWVYSISSTRIKIIRQKHSHERIGKSVA